MPVQRKALVALICVCLSINIASASLDLNLFSNSLVALDAAVSKLQSREPSSSVSFVSSSLTQVCLDGDQSRPANWEHIESVNQKLRELSEEVFRAGLDNFGQQRDLPPRFREHGGLPEQHGQGKPRDQGRSERMDRPKPHPRPIFSAESVCHRNQGEFCFAELRIVLNVSTHPMPVHLTVPHCVPRNLTHSCLDSAAREGVQNEWESVCQKLAHDSVQVLECKAHFVCGPPPRPEGREDHDDDAEAGFGRSGDRSHAHPGDKHERDEEREDDDADARGDRDDEQPRRGGHRNGPHRGGDRDDEEPRRGGNRSGPRRGGDHDDEEPRRGGNHFGPHRGGDRDDEEPRRGGNRSGPHRGGDRDDEEPRRGGNRSGPHRGDDQDESAQGRGPRRGGNRNQNGPRRGDDASEDEEPRRGDRNKNGPRRDDDEGDDDFVETDKSSDKKGPRRGDNPRRGEKPGASGDSSSNIDGAQETEEVQSQTNPRGPGRSFFNTTALAYAGAACGAGVVIGLISFGVYTIVRRRRQASAIAATAYSELPHDESCAVPLTPKHIA